ncbi:hypothetical protein F444_23126, partial [Phytophthora nicotianae P1976]
RTSENTRCPVRKIESEACETGTAGGASAIEKIFCRLLLYECTNATLPIIPSGFSQRCSKFEQQNGKTVDNALNCHFTTVTLPTKPIQEADYSV